MVSFMRKQTNWYFVTGSSKDFVIWNIDGLSIKLTDSIVYVCKMLEYGVLTD